MVRQLNLNRDQLDQCYELASHIVSNACKYIERHSSLSVERATLMLLGLDGEHRGRSLASGLVDSLTRDQLRMGAAAWWGKVLVSAKEDPNAIAEKLSRGKLKWSDLPEVSFADVKRETLKLAKENFHKIATTPAALPRGKFLTLASFTDTKAKRLRGDVHEWHHKEKGVAMARFHSPKYFQETWEEEELGLAFEKLDTAKVVPILEGLTLPEQTVCLLKKSFPRLGVDGWYSIWNKEVDEKRALVDQTFVLKLCVKCKTNIANRRFSFDKADMLLVSLLLYEQMAKRENHPLENILLGFDFSKECQGFFDQVALAQLLREVFSQSGLWSSLAENPFSFFTAAFTEMDGIEADSKQPLPQMQNIASEFSLSTYGQIARRAHSLLDQTLKLLRKIHHMTLWKFLEEESSKLGREGVFQKSYHYWNPLWQVSE